MKSADGIVDYIGNGSVTPYVEGETNGAGDRGQSYSYASAVYGDWVYINTMYGGLGIAAILKNGMSGLSPETATAMMNVMYNGNLYTGEEDGAYAGGILLKFNVKTGETKILMSKDENHIIPTFRNACEMNGKLYFVGMVIDTTLLTQEEISKAIAMQNGFPCIYEVDPKNNDKLTCIYNCVDVDGFRQLVSKNVFTSTRAIGTYKNSLIAGCLDTDGVFLCASNDPSAGQDSFKVIADMDDLYGYPAYHRQDVNGGGGIYQVIEYNDKLYVVVCTGTPETRNEQGTLQSFAIIRGDCNGDPAEKSSWTWTVLVGDENDGARYPFGIDKERISAGACSLEVYNDHLYIGDYNDVSSALQGFVFRKNFVTQATNLEQSINLYRMDKDENIEMIVGDPTETFPEGGISGLGSGYGNHMNQYTWQTTVYEGKMYLSTMDTTTLLEPIVQFTNGDCLEMTPDEWESQINYLRVLMELLLKKDDSKITLYSASSIMTADKAKADIQEAVIKANIRSNQVKFPKLSLFNASNTQKLSNIRLTDKQIQELVKDLMNGSISEGTISDDVAEKLLYINNMLDSLTELIDTTDILEFSNIYNGLLKILESIYDKLPEEIKALYDMLLSYATKENLIGLANSVQYFITSERGFDLYEIQEDEDGNVDINNITDNGFGDPYNHGLRIFAKTNDYLLVGTANPFYGTQLWRRANTIEEPSEESSEVSEDSSKPEESSEVSEDSSKPEESGEVSEDSSKPEESGEVSEDSSKPEESGEVSEDSSKPEESSEVSEDSSKPEESSKVSEDSSKAEENSEVSKNNNTSNTGDTANSFMMIVVIMAVSAVTAVTFFMFRKKKS